VAVIADLKDPSRREAKAPDAGSAAGSVELDADIAEPEQSDEHDR